MVVIDSHPTQELVISALKGDELAFNNLFERFYNVVYDFAVWQTGNPALAEDISQETFIRAYNKLDQLKPPYNIKSWLFRIARNLHIDHTRRQKPEDELDADSGVYDRIAAPDSTVPEESITAGELSNPAREAIQRLSTNHRTMLVMREIHDYSYGEIAEAMDVEVNYVKVNLHRARKSFEDAFSYRLLLEDGSSHCDTLEQMRFDSFHDGELTGQQVRIIKKHIKECDECQRRKRELVAIGRIFSLVPMLPPQPTTWGDVKERFRDQIEQGNKGQPEAQSQQIPPTVQVSAVEPSTSSGISNGIKLAGGLAAVLAVIIAAGLFLASGNEQVEPVAPIEAPAPSSEEQASPIEAASPNVDPEPNEIAPIEEPVNAEAPEATQDIGLTNPTPTTNAQNNQANDQPSVADPGGSTSPTATSTPEPTATPAPDRTVETVPVFNCTPLGGGNFEWYEAERVYEDGELVSEEITSGPVSGPWQPGCPPEPTPEGGSSDGGSSDGGSSDGGDSSPGEGGVCTADSQCPPGCLCLSGICTCPAT